MIILRNEMEVGREEKRRESNMKRWKLKEEEV
jgi:hypothetical protein